LLKREYGETIKHTGSQQGNFHVLLRN